eukprot:5639625-Pleurochrysis_carterae.AAC.1
MTPRKPLFAAAAGEFDGPCPHWDAAITRPVHLPRDVAQRKEHWCCLCTASRDACLKSARRKSPLLRGAMLGQLRKRCTKVKVLRSSQFIDAKSATFFGSERGCGWPLLLPSAGTEQPHPSECVNRVETIKRRQPAALVLAEAFRQAAAAR